MTRTTIQEATISFPPYRYNAFAMVASSYSETRAFHRVGGLTYSGSKNKLFAGIARTSSAPFEKQMASGNGTMFSLKFG